MHLLAAVFLLVLLHALFVSAEYAVVRTAYADKQLARRYTRSRRLLKLHEHLEDYLTLCQLAKTLLLLLMGLILGRWLGDQNLAVTDGSANLGIHSLYLYAIGLSGLVIGQQLVGFELPKALGVNRSDFLAERLSHFVFLSVWLLWPLLWVTQRTRRFLTRGCYSSSG